ncbi:MAG TPA: hypothetical protein VKU80_09225 [Planctomycetota bacterium]|nr:hypothetical protein [Planctomycetota bacterium]
MAGTSIGLHRAAGPQGAIEKQIVIPARYVSFIRVLLGLWLAICCFIVIALATYLIAALVRPAGTEEEPSFLLGTLLAFFALAGAFLAWRLAWVTKGREILELTPDRLTLRRQPALGAPERFDRARIQNLRVESYAGRLIYPSWGRRFVGKGNYFIAFEYEGKTHEIVRGLDRHEAENIAGELRPS